MASLGRIVEILEKNYGKPKRVERGKPLDVLVETILSQNTTDRNSSRAFSSLKGRFPRWEMVLEAGITSLEREIKVGGLPNIKAKRIKAVLKEIRRREGRLSLSSLGKKSSAECFSYLTSLDGVGPKTAACVLNFALGRDAIPADTHVHRVSNRLGIVKTKSPAKTQEILEKLVLPEKKYSLHLNLINHGRLVCKATRPACSTCFLKGVCPQLGVTKSR